MKSISFDQLKTMLKSMSYPIFTRIWRAEKNVQSLTNQVLDLKTQIPAKPQKIIFRGNSSNEYTCDLTFDDLWAMDTEQIANNAILIDRYGIEKAARSARKSGSVEYGIRNIQIDIDGNFEADMVTYFKQTLIIDWWAHADATTINVHTASSLSNQKIGAVDVPNVPILRAGNWGNYAIGPGLKVDEVADTLEINAGEGLEVAGDALRVKPEGEYELIDTITVEEEVNTINRSLEPDGTDYNFKKLFIKAHIKPAQSETALTYSVADMKCRIAMNHINKQETFATTELMIENGKFKSNCSYGFNGEYAASAIYTESYHAAMWDLDAIKKLDLIASGMLMIPSGSTFEIWGVRAQ